MIEFTKGDMFEEAADIRVNTVNCKGVMGAGVALAFKNRYPEMFKDYQRACAAGEVQPGRLHVWKTLTGEWVVNFPTKRDWRDPSQYEDIASGLSALRAYLQSQGPVSVVLPALGCGHGGLDWSKVAPMIEEGLADLEARIRVFEPADSRAAGRSVSQAPSQEQLAALDRLGFRAIELGQELQVVSPTAYLKGNAGLMTNSWIALLPSKDPGDREMAALEAVATEMTGVGNVPVATMYSTKATENVVRVFLDRGIAVVLILPFGPLTKKSVAEGGFDRGRGSVAVVSISSVDSPWSKSNASNAYSLLRAGSFGSLISDPTPEWLTASSLSNLSRKPLYYLRYGDTSPETRTKLERGGARSIGRRLQSGAPNLTPLLHPEEAPTHATGNTHVTPAAECFNEELSSFTPARLRDVAAEIERAAGARGTVSFSVPSAPETAALREALRSIFSTPPAEAEPEAGEFTRKAGGAD
jgi:O-acetyl-ADP-ribose deacetylase (regulator of RNase III)